MFLSSFEKLRTKLLAVDIVNMAHLGARAFEEIGGEVVQTTSFVIRKSHIADYIIPVTLCRTTTVRAGNVCILPDSDIDINHVLHRIELSSCDVPRLLQVG